MKRLDALHWSLLLALAALLSVFAFTPYRYEHWVGGSIVRIHRLTGNAERLTMGGWRPMVAQKTQAWVLD